MFATRHPGRLAVLVAALSHHGTDAALPAFPLEVSCTDADGSRTVLVFTRLDLARCYELGLLPRPDGQTPAPVEPLIATPDESLIEPCSPPAGDLTADQVRALWRAQGLGLRHQRLWLAAGQQPVTRKTLARLAGMTMSSYSTSAITTLVRLGYLTAVLEGVKRGPKAFPLMPT